ncbi:MAG: hypothetical protein HYR85_01830 [Planctomycetes bacterium]|nr:hypothetical protein [Planctomycetota bacterium]
MATHNESMRKRLPRAILVACAVVVSVIATPALGSDPSPGEPPAMITGSTSAARATDVAGSSFEQTFPEFRTLGADASDWNSSTNSASAAKSILADPEQGNPADRVADGQAYQVETDSPLLNVYLSEMQTEVYRRYRRLYDTRSVLASKRFYDFTRRSGAPPSFARFDLPEGSSNDEQIALGSALEAARKTMAETEAVEYLVQKLGAIESVTNWSLVHGAEGYRSGFDLRSTARSSGESRGDATLVDAELSSRFAVQRLVDDPKEVVEIRTRYQRIVEISVFPLKQEIEMSSPLLRGKRYDVRASFTIDSGLSRNDFLVSFNLRF